LSIRETHRFDPAEMMGFAALNPILRTVPAAGTLKRQFGTTVDFVGDNRLIFDLGGNKYRLIVHVSYTFSRVLVKFVGTHAEYDRINPETVTWRG
jgi:mRNA-degrading endonuclease HigB of HigAB toxin-antitoxin module